MKRRDWLKGLAALGFASVFGQRVLARRTQDKPEFFVDPASPEPKPLGTGIVTKIEDHGIRGESLEITYFDEEMEQAAWLTEEPGQSEELYQEARQSEELYEDAPPPPQIEPGRTYPMTINHAGFGTLRVGKGDEELRLVFSGMNLKLDYQEQYGLSFGDNRRHYVMGQHRHGDLRLSLAAVDHAALLKLQDLCRDYANSPNAVLSVPGYLELELTKLLVTGYWYEITHLGDMVIYSELDLVFIRANPTTGCSNA